MDTKLNFYNYYPTWTNYKNYNITNNLQKKITEKRTNYTPKKLQWITERKNEQLHKKNFLKLQKKKWTITQKLQKKNLKERKKLSNS